MATGMVMNDAMATMGEANDPGLSSMQHALPIQILLPADITNAVAFLVSDEAKFITGITRPLNAGFPVR
ncbi:hypothetical protein [Mycolicibacterium flavescens]|uniref:Uncharacterized protein n=1 Tax=Mycolicibacterium flavescens TaxID=1776 RepID=A0A1E3RNB3_MYCFV|nr:hypothetical protein BHQ18_04560 [Mycolicibacterium flavescens]